MQNLAEPIAHPCEDMKLLVPSLLGVSRILIPFVLLSRALSLCLFFDLLLHDIFGHRC